MDVYDDRVEIVNPGGLPQGLDQRDFGKLSVRRNLIIADLFHRMGKVERIGSGIGRMQDILRASRLKPPQFEITNFFRVIFYRNPEYSLKRLPDEKTEKAGKTRVKTVEKIRQILKDNPTTTIPEISRMTGLTIKGVEWNIKELKKRKLIKRIGPDKGGHWEILG